MTSVIKSYRSKDTILVVFGGIVDGVDIPRFEFVKVTEQLEASVIYVRDLYQAWYQKGLLGISDDIFSTIPFLRTLTAGYNKIVTCGNSMGAFAALLYGAILPAQKVLVFSPQTTIDKGWMKRNDDTRWRKYLDKVYLLEKPCVFDVHGIVKNAKRTDIHIWYASDYRQDVRQAMRLEMLKNVTSYPIKGAHRHRVVKHLRDTGQLIDILRHHIDETD